MSGTITDPTFKSRPTGGTLPPTPMIVPAAVTPPVEFVPPPRRRRKRIVLGVLLTLILVGGAVAAAYFIHVSGLESTDDAFVEGHVVSISPQVSARVLSLNIDDNTLVKKGEVLVQLDPTDYAVALEQAEATRIAMAGKEVQSEREIDSAKAMRDVAAAEVHVAEANSKNARDDYDRFNLLAKQNAGAVSKQQLDSLTAAFQSNQAQVDQAKAKLAQAESDIETRKATAAAAAGDLKKADADVHKAEVNLTYCTIVAPEDGRITRKNVEPGSYVQTGEQLFAIVPSTVWVVANYKETQLERMRVGQKVEVFIDAFPGKTYRGHVDSIQAGTGSRFSVLPAENATGNFVKVVQRLPVKILLDTPNNDPDHQLVPGMSVQPDVVVSP